MSRVDSLEESIQELDLDITQLVAEVNNINEQVVDVKNRIETNKETITVLKNKIDESTKILLEYMVYLYKK
jgi:peptidoglycan hydrolase CwlO-like protein